LCALLASALMCSTTSNYLQKHNQVFRETICIIRKWVWFGL
jgi:hypothetical protein